MKKNIALITDSTCDIPQNFLDQYQIEVVPLTIVWGEEQFRDGVDLEAEDFYQRLISDSVIPTTSQPTPQEMVQAYENAKSVLNKRTKDLKTGAQMLMERETLTPEDFPALISSGPKKASRGRKSRMPTTGR